MDECNSPEDTANFRNTKVGTKIFVVSVNGDGQHPSRSVSRISRVQNSCLRSPYRAGKSNHISPPFCGITVTMYEAEVDLSFLLPAFQTPIYLFAYVSVFSAFVA